MGMTKSMALRKLLLLAVAGVFVCTISAVAAFTTRAVAGGPAVFAPDKGKLTIQLDGKTVNRPRWTLTIPACIMVGRMKEAAN